MAELHSGQSVSDAPFDGETGPFSSEGLQHGVEARVSNLRRMLGLAGVCLVVAIVIYLLTSYRKGVVMTENSPVIPQTNEQVNNELAHIPAESLRRGFEARPVNIRGVVLFTVTLLVVSGIIFVILWWMLSAWQEQTLVPRVQIPPVNVTVQPAPGPFPVVNNRENLAEVVNPALANLHSYGWVDQKAGIVRIPIDRAMTLLLQRGLPARAAKPPDFGLEAAHKLDSEGGQDPTNDFTLR
ncbi:MAG: hypothetical protein NT075_21175 [Chloroflexi bacterium]|nr:hypothetical protein [Chloroflexota bacterium]